jgi:hypothetical protein
MVKVLRMMSIDALESFKCTAPQASASTQPANFEG